MSEDEIYMRRCFQLAKNGLGHVSPNPMVGCVLVSDHTIIGEGFHQQYGSLHAEPNAIENVINKDFIAESTLYVNLEPCSHYGKTPPCAELIIEKGIKRVVVCNRDPNPLVSGRGIAMLQEKGIHVTTSVLEKEGLDLNRRFFTFMQKKRPYIILKWAQTLDGYMDISKSKEDSSDYWISNHQLKILSHKWRTEEDGIMIGTQTAENDNPQLTSRLWSGKNPTRIILDNSLRLDTHLKVFHSDAKTYIYTSQDKESNNHLTYIKVDFQKIISEILSDLYSREIQSVIIEGGKKLLESFITQNVWDEARVLIGNKLFMDGLKAPVIPFLPVEISSFDHDKVLFYKNLTSDR